MSDPATPLDQAAPAETDAAPTIQTGPPALASEDRRTAEIEEAWGYYRIWAMTARTLQGQGAAFREWTVRLTFVAILLGPLAQYLGVLGVSNSITAGVASLVAWLSSVLMTGVAFFNEKILGPERDTPWLRSRAIAEKIKSEVFRYVMRVDPYEEPGENALSEQVFQIKETIHGISPAEISDEERKNKLPPSTMEAEEYIEHRLVDQIDYFRKRRDENQQIVDRYKLLGWVFGAIAALLVLPAPAAIKLFQDVKWQDLTALGASVASGVSGFLVANMSAGRFKYLADSYERARCDLDALRSSWRTSIKTPQKLALLVTRAEDILAKENAAWYQEMARPTTPSGS